MSETAVDDAIGKSLSFVGDELVVTNPDHIKKLDRKRWSASSMKSIESCPSRWVIEKLLPEEPDPFGPAEKGSAAHKVFEVMFSLPPEQRTLDKANEILSTIHVDFPDEVNAPDSEAERTLWRGEVMKLITPLWKIENPELVDVHACEEKIEGEVGGVPLIGFMDRTDNAPGGGYLIKDYKGLAVDTAIPTPSGWVTMEDLKVGDEVFGTDGLAHKVLKKSGTHHRRCFRMEFSGETIICDNVQLWDAEVIIHRYENEVRHYHNISTDDLYRVTLKYPDSTVRVYNAAPLVETPEGHIADRINRLNALIEHEYGGPCEDEWVGFSNVADDDERLELVRLIGSLGFTPHQYNGLVFFRKTEMTRQLSAFYPTDSVPTQCIEVDSEDHLYLAGESYFPVHNTGKASTEATRRRFGDPHGDQLRLYARAIENRDGKSPEGAFIYYTGAGTSYEADLSKAAIDSVEHEFVQTYNEMKASAESGHYRTNAGPLCGWCPLATVCPTARKAGKDAPKVEKAKLGTALGIRVVDPQQVPDEPVELPEVDVPPVLVQTAPNKRTRKGKKMHVWPIDDGKVFIEHSTNGELMAASAAALGVIGTASLAVELMDKAGVGMKVNSVSAMTKVLGWIIEDVQKKVYTSNTVDWQSGMNTRIRGVMRTMIDILPPPFTGQAEDWSKWAAKVSARCVVVLDAGYDLYTNGSGEPWDQAATYCQGSTDPWKGAPAAE